MIEGDELEVNLIVPSQWKVSFFPPFHQGLKGAPNPHPRMVARENLTPGLFTAGTQNKDQIVEYHKGITGSKNEDENYSRYKQSKFHT